MSSTPVLIFDLDGTLTDSRSGITRCMRHACEALGREVPDDDVLASYIGPPLRATFRAIFGSSDDELIEDAVRRYRERYFEKGLFENEVYEGIPGMLERLHGAGHRLYVVTSKMTVLAEKILEHFALRRYFEGIHGTGLDAKLDDKSVLLGYMLEAERLVHADAVMIGDRSADIVAAKSNGVASIGVTYGYGSRDELIEAGADTICDSPAAILTAVSREPIS